MEPSKQPITDAIRELTDGADAARTVSDWTRFLGAEQAEDGGELAGALQELDAPQWGSVVREMFSDLYASPLDTVREAPEGERASWVREAVQRVAETPEWQQLRAATAGDEWAAGMGTAELARAMGPILEDLAPKTDERAAQQAVNTLQDMLQEAEQAQAAAQQAQDQDAVEATEAEAEQLRGALRDAEEALAEAQADSQRAAQQLQAMVLGGAGQQLRQAVQVAAAAAAAEAEAVRAGMRGLGYGDGAGSPTRCAEPPQAVRDALRKNPQLLEIARMAGRLRAEARRRQKTRTNDAREETTGVEAGADVARLLPAEIMHLGDEDAELLLYRRLLERSAMQYQLRGTERAARGPLILLLDESGSMEGARNTWAKAAALALMDVAQLQRRPFALVHFDGKVQRVDHVPAGARLGLQQLLGMLCTFSGGGTHLARAIAHGTHLVVKAKQAGKPLAKADLVLLTDGDDGRKGEIQMALDQMRAAGAGLHLIGLEMKLPAQLRDAAETVVELTEAQMGQDGTIGAVLGMA